MRVSRVVAVLVVLLGMVIVSACDRAATPTLTSAPNASEGEILMRERCTRCHDVSRVTFEGKSAGEWRATVDTMIRRGASLNADEIDTLVDYLAQTYK